MAVSWGGIRAGTFTSSSGTGTEVLMPLPAGATDGDFVVFGVVCTTTNVSLNFDDPYSISGPEWGTQDADGVSVAISSFELTTRALNVPFGGSLRYDPLKCTISASREWYAFTFITDGSLFANGTGAMAVNQNVTSLSGSATSHTWAPMSYVSSRSTSTNYQTVGFIVAESPFDAGQTITAGSAGGDSVTTLATFDLGTTQTIQAVVIESSQDEGDPYTLTATLGIARTARFCGYTTGFGGTILKNPAVQSQVGTSFQMTVDTDVSAGTLHCALYAAQPRGLNADDFVPYSNSNQISYTTANPEPHLRLQQFTQTVTATGTQTITFTGLTAGNYYWPVVSHSLNGINSRHAVFPKQFQPIPSNGLYNPDIYALKSVTPISGDAASFIADLASVASAGDVVFIYLTFESTNGANFPFFIGDPDGIAGVWTDVAAVISNDVEAANFRFNGWLDNGSYDTVTIEFDAGITQYSGFIIVMSGLSSISTYNLNDEPSSSNYESFTFTGGANSSQFLHVAMGYNVAGGNRLSSVAFDDRNEDLTAFYRFGSNITSVDGLTWAFPYLSFVNNADVFPEHRITYDTTLTSARHNGTHYRPLAINLTSVSIINLAWDNFDIQYTSNYAAGHVWVNVFFTDPGSPTDQELIDNTFPADIRFLTYIDGPSPNTINVSGLAEKQTYYIYLTVENYLDTTWSGTATTPDGPNEVVVCETEQLVLAGTPAVVNQGYRTSEIVSVNPPTWQDGLEGIIITTTNVATHANTRVFTKNREHVVTAYAKNQLTVTATKADLVDDVDYILQLTDYYPFGPDSLHDYFTAIEAAQNDLFLAETWFCFDYERLLDGYAASNWLVPGSTCYQPYYTSPVPANDNVSCSFNPTRGCEVKRLADPADLITGTAYGTKVHDVSEDYIVSNNERAIWSLNHALLTDTADTANLTINYEVTWETKVRLRGSPALGSTDIVLLSTFRNVTNDNGFIFHADPVVGEEGVRWLPRAVLYNGSGSTRQTVTLPDLPENSIHVNKWYDITVVRYANGNYVFSVNGVPKATITEVQVAVLDKYGGSAGGTYIDGIGGTGWLEIKGARVTKAARYPEGQNFKPYPIIDPTVVAWTNP